MKKYHQEQLERIDRLMEIINSKDPYRLISSLTFYDIIIFACQCIWHLKDWILNDPNFGAADIEELKKDIHNEKCLLICSDLANGSKHLTLENPKTDFSFFERSGIHLDTRKGVHQEYYYIISSNPDDPYYGMEIREFLSTCMKTWDEIINKHYLQKWGPP